MERLRALRASGDLDDAGYALALAVFVVADAGVEGRRRPIPRPLQVAVNEAAARGLSVLTMDALGDGARVGGPPASSLCTKIRAAAAPFRDTLFSAAHFPYLLVQAAPVGGSRGGSVVVATGVTAVGDRQVAAIGVGDPVNQAFWTGFLGGLRARGISALRRVVSDALPGLDPAVRVFFGDVARRPPRGEPLAEFPFGAWRLAAAVLHAPKRARPTGREVRSIVRTARGAPSVSVVIPTRNRVDLLAEAVGSVFGQTRQDWELVVVDDASDDQTWEWLTGLDDSRVRALRLPEHSERSTARNRGLAVCRGEFVAFLDDDDRLRSRALELLLQAITNRPGLVAAAGASEDFDATTTWASRGHPSWPLRRKAWAEAVFGWFPLVGTTILRRRVLDGAGAWAEALTVGEDHDLWLRITERGPVAFIPETVLERRLRYDHCHVPHETRRDTAQEYAKTLSKRRRRRQALRLLQARDAFLVGQTALNFCDHRLALRSILRSAGLAPTLVTSSLTGPQTVQALILALHQQRLRSRRTTRGRSHES